MADKPIERGRASGGATGGEGRGGGSAGTAQGDVGAAVTRAGGAQSGVGGATTGGSDLSNVNVPGTSNPTLPETGKGGSK